MRRLPYRSERLMSSDAPPCVTAGVGKLAWVAVKERFVHTEDLLAETFNIWE